MTKPITPAEVTELRTKAVIPGFMFEIFNLLIAKNFRNGRARVYQSDVVAEMKKRQIDTKKAFEERWLDVEDSYRQAGWSVMFDQPAYCETYPAYFVFRKKTKALTGVVGR